jgi:hypothetical protein
MEVVVNADRKVALKVALNEITIIARRCRRNGKNVQSLRKPA